MNKDMKWYVILWDFNRDEIEYFNIFQSRSFSDGIRDLLKQKGLTREEFIEAVRHETKYSFWCKCEYEIIVSGVFGDKDKKVDAYSQLEKNLDILSDYIAKCNNYKFKKD